MLVGSASPVLAQQIREVVDGVTVKLGGHPLEGALFSALSGAAAQKKEPKSCVLFGSTTAVGRRSPHSEPEEKEMVGATAEQWHGREQSI